MEKDPDTIADSAVVVAQDVGSRRGDPNRHLNIGAGRESREERERDVG
jgi:hypothetical protein